MRIKRYLLILVIIIVLFSHPSLNAEANEPDLTAEAAVLVDRDSGRILYEHNAFRKRPMASTTKVMTALLALEYGNLDDTVFTSERAAAIGGSSIWLSPGEEKTLEELLYGLMLRSGNDAAAAIAEHIGGSVETFAVMMTQKARTIGALDTSFRNPHGLHDENHFTTAYDLALITAHALKIPKFREIIVTPETKISWPDAEWDRRLRNQNQLLDLYPGADGVKTGWTTPAGRCFVGSATRNNWQLVSVVLNAGDTYADTMELLDYGFNNYKMQRLISEGQLLRRVEVQNGIKDSLKILSAEDFHYPLKESEEKNLRYLFELEQFYDAPVGLGAAVGELIIYHGEEKIGILPLVAGEEVERIPFYKQFLRFVRRIFHN